MRTEISCGPKGEKLAWFWFSVRIQTVKTWPIDPLGLRNVQLEVTKKSSEGRPQNPQNAVHWAQFVGPFLAGKAGPEWGLCNRNVYVGELQMRSQKGSHKLLQLPDPSGDYRRDGTGRDGTGRDGTGRDGTGRDGTGRDGTGRDGTGRDGTGLYNSTRIYSTLLYSTLLYYLLYSTLNLLYSTLLYSTLLYSTLLDSTLLEVESSRLGSSRVESRRVE